MLKVHVAFPFSEGPSGGGNKFLQALREIWRAKGCYADDPDDARVVLFNSHHNLRAIWRMRLARPDVALVHRVDGPVSSIRGRDNGEDAAIIAANAALADGTIFQSAWSRARNVEKGLAPPAGRDLVIMNAPSPHVFNRHGRVEWSASRRTRLIATSWSSNVRKGFDDYQYLDEQLDLTRYEMTFVGNSPVQFRNIRMLPPLRSAELAAELRRHDIYVAASRQDPCSNALLEALHCGTPALGFRDGGHPELIGNGGILYSRQAEMIPALAQMSANFAQYEASIALPQLDAIAESYLSFCRDLHSDTQARRRALSPRLARALLRWKIGRGVDYGRSALRRARAASALQARAG